MGNQKIKSIFDFGSKELSGSAFWAWVLNEACVDKQNLHAVAVGEAFLAKLGVSEDIVNGVETEVNVKSGRVDIALLGDQDDKCGIGKEKRKPIAFIENKHFSTADVNKVIEQVNRYAGEDTNLKKIIMTWRHDTASQWNVLEGTNNICFLGLEDQFMLIKRAKPKICPIINAYFDYISELRTIRKRRIKELSTKPFSKMSEDVWTEEDSLYEMMFQLTKGLKNDDDKSLRVHVGNSGSRKWVQAAFCVRENDAKKYRKFFYRLDRDVNRSSKKS